jgi:hypothetical protein
MGLFQMTSDVPSARQRRSFLFDLVSCENLPAGLSLSVPKLDFSPTQPTQPFLEATHAD